MGISLIIFLKIDEYCSADVADISSKVNNLLTMHSNKPLHEYPKTKKIINYQIARVIHQTFCSKILLQ